MSSQAYYNELSLEVRERQLKEQILHNEGWERNLERREEHIKMMWRELNEEKRALEEERRAKPHVHDLEFQRPRYTEFIPVYHDECAYQISQIDRRCSSIIVRDGEVTSVLGYVGIQKQRFKCACQYYFKNYNDLIEHLHKCCRYSGREGTPDIRIGYFDEGAQVWVDYRKKKGSYKRRLEVYEDRDPVAKRRKYSGEFQYDNYFNL